MHSKYHKIYKNNIVFPIKYLMQLYNSSLIFLAVYSDFIFTQHKIRFQEVAIVLKQWPILTWNDSTHHLGFYKCPFCSSLLWILHCLAQCWYCLSNMHLFFLGVYTLCSFSLTSLSIQQITFFSRFIFSFPISYRFVIF